MAAVEYQEKLIATEEYRGYCLRLFLNNFNRVLWLAVPSDYLTKEAEITRQRQLALVPTAGWYERCAARFFVANDYNGGDEAVIGVCGKPLIEVIAACRDEGVFARDHAFPYLRREIDVRMAARGFGRVLPKFRVELTTLAMMRGCIEIEAETAAQAEAKALERAGDVQWGYEGACEGENGPSVQDCREVL